ncbi:clostripain-related cysteine peptidase [Kosmotoga pacifica]|uniref:clostripain-related cysteine peptidase n=1 Tax=Kosmotoga pacifica TaxID=1330330 RepID=UPI002584976B|nr:clostripain-related cysteine peptidase [Kosmotoga pacifica]
MSSNSSLNLTIDSPKNAVAVYQTSYYIEADNETHYTGKWAHITVTVRDRFDNPVPNIPVAFNFSSSSSQILNLTDKSKVDVDPIVYTDSNGIASLDGYFSESSVETVKAYLVDYPNIYSNFQVNVLTPNWIFLILMGADNNLESSAIFDLIEMSTTNPGIAIVGIADVSYLESGDGQLSGVTDDFLFMLDEAGTIYDEPLGIEVDSGSPETLEALISGFYGIESNYKALVLWNHGFAWFDENEPRTRGIIYDDTNNTFLRIRDVQNAIISATNGAGFDILGMDACLMSSVEIAYQLKDTASYFVSSAFTEPGSGWDYSFLDDIEAYHSPFEVGKLIVDSYVASLPTTPKLSLAVWDLSYLDELYNSINAFSYELDSILDDGIKSKILNVYYPNLTQYYDGSNLIVDLGDFLGYIYYDDEVTQNVKDLALEAWYDLTAAVPYSTVRGGTNNSKGTSIFFPDSLNVYNSFYDSFYELDFWWNWWEILVRHIIDPDWELGVDLYGPNYYGDIILLSNESVDGDNFEPIGTLNSEGSKSLEIPKGLPLGAYRVDYLFELPEDATVDKIVGPNERNRTPSKIGVARYFWVHDFRTNSDYLLEATLQSSGNYCEIWVEDPGEINTAMADQLAAEFDNIIYSLIVNNFYTPSDVNADGKVAILCFDIQDNFETVGSYTAGYFSPVDLYSQDYYPTSNEMEIFYIDTYPTMHYPSTDPIDVSKAYSTLVHEFQHMVNFNRNVFVEFGASMDTWLNEALSMAAEHIYEGVQTDRISYYNASSSISNGHSLLYWDRYGDVLSNYALSYLFGQYLRIQAGAGNTIFKEILMDYNNDYRCVENAIHNHVDSQLDFGRFMTYFRLALNLRQEFGYFGFKGDPDFATIETKLFETLPESIRGGGAILVSILSNPYVKPYDSGEHIKPVGIDLEAINF